MTDDHHLADLALRQHGVVSLEQLYAAGFTYDAVEWRARRGRLHRIHRGVYAVGHRRLTERGHLWAAMLAVPGSALSHWSAAAVWDLAKLPSGPLHVTTAGGSRSTKALRVHRRSAETTTQDGLTVTTVGETLADLARHVSQHRLERLVARAEQLRVLDVAAVTGPPKLLAALSTAAYGEATRSELEEMFLEAVAREGLPRPEVNQIIGDFEVDFVWREQRLIVETDGAETHLTRRAFENDRARDAALVSEGWRVVRFTARQVTRDPAGVARTVRALL